MINTDTCSMCEVAPSTPLEIAKAIQRAINMVVGDLTTLAGIGKYTEDAKVPSESMSMVADNLQDRIVENLSDVNTGAVRLVTDIIKRQSQLHIQFADNGSLVSGDTTVVTQRIGGQLVHNFEIEQCENASGVTKHTIHMIPIHDDSGLNTGKLFQVKQPGPVYDQIISQTGGKLPPSIKIVDFRK